MVVVVWLLRAQIWWWYPHCNLLLRYYHGTDHTHDNMMNRKPMLNCFMVLSIMDQLIEMVVLHLVKVVQKAGLLRAKGFLIVYYLLYRFLWREFLTASSIAFQGFKRHVRDLKTSEREPTINFQPIFVFLSHDGKIPLCHCVHPPRLYRNCENVLHIHEQVGQSTHCKKQWQSSCFHPSSSWGPPSQVQSMWKDM